MPSGMTGGSPEPASFEASLAVRIGSFLTIGTIRPRPTISSACANAPSGALPCREVDDREVVLLELGAELQVGGGDDDRLRRRRHRLHRLVLHEVVGAVREPASGEDGDGEDGKDSAAHDGPLAIRSASARDRLHRERSAHRMPTALTSRATGSEHHEVERIVDGDLRTRCLLRAATLRFTSIVAGRRGASAARSVM